MGRGEPKIYQHMEQTVNYVNSMPTVTEKGEFGGQLPDISKFNAFLNDVQNMPLDEFASEYKLEKKGKFVEKLTFDPTKGKYFDMFMDTSKRPPSDHYTHDDTKLNPAQMEAFQKNGMVVTEQEESMGWCYYKIFNNDLPVLITTDSILHAFHKSYDSVLEELEQTYCIGALKKIFAGMQASLKSSVDKYTEEPFKQSFKDADFFITVAANLLNSEEYYRLGSSADPAVNGTQKEIENKYRYSENPVKAQIPTVLGNDDSVQTAIEMCKANQILRIPLFGKEREIDFSLFKPRGHYAKSALLRQYFRAVSWLGEIDMIVAGEGSNSRQLGAAVVLHMLLTQNSEAEKEFHIFNRTIEALVGPANSMDFKQLDFMLNSIFKMKTFENLNSEQALQALAAKILESELGIKKYNGETGGRRFTFMGKKFSIDNWLQTRMVTHDPGEKLMWNGSVVERHSTSCVEVAFAVFGNDAATPVIHERITAQKPEKVFRDGLVFHPNLVAGRKTIEALPEGEWKASLYNYWLNALRKLSVPMDERFPQAMRTKAFAMKNMNSQLGSWAQLRHDNILYVEQGRRSCTCCEYPDGYVEPFVEFWEALEKMCVVASQVMGEVAPATQNRWKPSSSVFFKKFAQHVRVLRDISVLELAQKPLEANHVAFLKSVVERHQTYGSGAGTFWLGWYPSLFYAGTDDVTNPDLISCDTFTNPPSDMEPGCVVHQALGYPRRMLMAVDSGPNVTVYAGPVYGFYEFELKGTQRMSDEEWKKLHQDKKVPPVPEWTAPFLVC